MIALTVFLFVNEAVLPSRRLPLKQDPACAATKSEPPASPKRPESRVMSPPLMGVITRSWASRGCCSGGEGATLRAVASPAPVTPAPFCEPRRQDTTGEPGGGRRTAGRRGAADAESGRGGRAACRPVAVPGTSLLPHGPVMQDAALALANLSLTGRSKLSSACTGEAPRFTEAAGKVHDDAVGTRTREGAHGLDTASAWTPLGLAAAAGATSDAGTATLGLQNVSECERGVAETAADAQCTEARSVQLAQYLSAGGWRGTAVHSTPAVLPRMPGAAGGQGGGAGGAAAPLDPQWAGDCSHGVDLVRQGEQVAAPAVTVSLAGFGSAVAGRVAAVQSAGPRAGHSVMHARAEVCMWREDMEDRAGREAADAARAKLAPVAQELAAVRPAAARDLGGATARRDGRSGRGASGARPGRGAAAARGRDLRRGQPGRGDALSGRLGYGEEEDCVSLDARGTGVAGGAGPPDRQRAVGGAGDASVDGEEGQEQRADACGDAPAGVGECRGFVAAGGSLLLTGTAVGSSRQEVRAALGGRPRLRAAQDSPDRPPAQRGQHDGGTAAVGDCRAVHRAPPEGEGEPRRPAAGSTRDSGEDEGAHRLSTRLMHRV